MGNIQGIESFHHVGDVNSAIASHHSVENIIDIAILVGQGHHGAF